MKTNTKEISYQNTHLISDWAWAASLIVGGIYIAHFALSSQIWNRVVLNSNQGFSIGKIQSEKGITHIKASQSSAWKNVEDSALIQDGYSFTTGANSIANLTLNDSLELQLMEKSEGKALIEPLLNSGFFSKIQEASHPRYILELTEGVFQATIKKRHSPTSFSFLGKQFELTAHSSPTIVQFQTFPDPNSSNLILTLKATNEVILSDDQPTPNPQKLSANSIWSLTFSPTQIKAQLNGSRTLASATTTNKKVLPYIPQILSPFSGSRFHCEGKKLQRVGLRWVPLTNALNAEIEISHQGKSKPNTELKITPAGALLMLPCGSYTWKVRSINSAGQHSEWSNSYSFHLQENLQGEIPLTLIESYELEKEEAKKRVELELEEQALHDQQVQAEQARLDQIKKDHLKKIMKAQKIREAKAKLAKRIESQNYRKTKYRSISEAAKSRQEIIHEKYQVIEQRN